MLAKSLLTMLQPIFFHIDDFLEFLYVKNILYIYKKNPKLVERFSFFEPLNIFHL